MTREIDARRRRERSRMTTPNDAAGSAFLDGAIAAVSGDGANDEARDALVVIRDLRERKLWHELTVALERAVAPPVSEVIRARVSGGLRGLYEGVVREVETRLNPLKTAHVAVAVSDAFG